MPELPELEALRTRIGPRVEGQVISACELNPRKSYLLRHPPLAFVEELGGAGIERMWRRGKHLVWDLATGSGPRHLVINLMLGGRLAISEASVAPAAAWVLRLLLGRVQMVYLDHRDMGRIYLVADLDQVPAWSELGPEADLLEQEGLASFRRRLRRHREEIKDILRNQHFLSGIGNAYSDEILFEAGLLPMRRRASLDEADEERLFMAIPAVLGQATAAILANPGYTEAKQDRTFMKVHTRGGADCPRCGHRISQLGSSRSPVNFCRGCQH